MRYNTFVERIRAADSAQRVARTAVTADGEEIHADSFVYAGDSEGASGGWFYHDKVSPVFRFPALNLIRTPLRNLYACGHYALYHTEAES